METTTTAVRLAAALAIGLIVGLERGWRDRGLPEGGRAAGLRTFTLLGLLGGVMGVLQPQLGSAPLVAVIVAVAAVFGVSYAVTLQESGNRSLTSIVAALITLALGAMAALGMPAVAVACAVLVAVLLDLKPLLHRWLRLIAAEELRAALQLMVLSAVILPLLPNADIGPYQALNPYQLWLAVVLVAGLSLAGHFAMRLTGTQHGVVLTGLLGGLASSTAVTVALARRARGNAASVSSFTAGVLCACGVMFVRMCILVAALQPALLRHVAWPFAAMALTVFVLGAWQWRLGVRAGAPAEGTRLETNYDLLTAVGFAAFMAVVAVLAQAVRSAWGDSGLYGLAALSGLADVDAMVVSIARLHTRSELQTVAAVTALLVLVSTNQVAKAAAAWALGGYALGWRVTAAFAMAMAAGFAALWLGL